MGLEKFAVFILTHGRPDRVLTAKTLKKQGYTGDFYIVIDNEDKTGDEYKKRWGDRVIVFDKLAISEQFDTGDNFNYRKAIVFGNNALFEIARNLGLDYFLQLDDDYSSFVYKFTHDLVFGEQRVKSLDQLFWVVLDYYKSINALSIAMGQNGDFIGGKKSTYGSKVCTARKCMNTFFLSPHRPFWFVGTLNEDVSTYVLAGLRGDLMLRTFNTAIIQSQTQASKGGITDMYKIFGTYVKSFYSVMYAPSCVTIKDMGDKHRRIHHHVSWKNAAVQIIREDHKK